MEHPETIIVGIGASAGGIAPLQTFFSHIPEGAGIAYVVIQHLSPRHESKMPEILATRTPLPIHVAEEGMKVLPDHIYLIPARHNLNIREGVLHLEKTLSSHYPNLPIDRFFHALGVDQKDHGVAIVLSGTGSDGSRGLCTVKQSGGLVMVQSPDQAEFTGMPLNAMATQMVDHVLTVEEMPAMILKYFRPDFKFPVAPPPEESPPDPAHIPELEDAEDVKAFRQIINLISQRTHIPFHAYRPPTLLRRIKRRMEKQAIPELPKYLAFLKVRPPEVSLLAQDCLIGVTHFFRDPEAFVLIQDHVLPSLFADLDQETPIRIWVCGCSTGEEAYSLAILIHEYQQARQLNRPVQIFASDVSQQMIEQASLGIFSQKKVATLSQGRLESYFIPEGPVYRIRQHIRERIIFSRHNVLSDPPFINLDLISCRNVMIYLEDHAQDQVLDSFHMALKPSGFLWTGPSEMGAQPAPGFDLLNTRWKLFRRRLSPRSQPSLRPRHTMVRQTSLLPRRHAPTKVINAASGLPEHYIQRILIQACVPDGLVMDQDLNILYVVGDAGRFLPLPKAGMDTRLPALLPAPVVQATRRCLDEKAFEEFRLEVSMPRLDGISEAIKLGIRPLGAKAGEEHDFFFLEMTPPTVTAPSQNREKWQKELYLAHETAAEQQATLDMVRQELSATQEELDALSQELRTMSDEMESKDKQLGEADAALRAILSTSSLMLIFLNSRMEIQQISAAAKARFASSAASGMALQDLREALAPLVRQTLESHRPQQAQIPIQGETYVWETGLYQIDNETEGVLLHLTPA